MTIELIDFWRNQDYKKAPYIANQDVRFIPEKKIDIFFSYDSYVNSESSGDQEDKHLHLGLLPLPYVGNLRESSIFILMLNPGLSATDYFAEYNYPEYREIYFENLNQKIITEFPFHFLDPKLAWHEGFQYWHKKFMGLAQIVSSKKKLSYYDSLKFLSNHISCLELMPYHSRSFGSDSFINNLPSVKIMRAFVNDNLLPKTRKNKVTIIVTRKAKVWEIAKDKNVIVYDKTEARSAHLTSNSKGGKAILRALGLL